MNASRRLRFWAPYVATGFAMATALGLNLWAGNELWLRYTLIGTGAFLIIVGGVRAWGWSVPPSAAWTVGLVAALHYIGGSLSGLHQIGGVNGLYFVLPWWDNAVHFLGSAAVAVAAYALLRRRLSAASRTLCAFLAASVSSLVGVLVELYEFSQFVWFGTVDQGFYTNTLLDLYYNLIGGVVGVATYARWADAARPAPAASPRTPVAPTSPTQ